MKFFFRFFYFNIKTQASVWTLPETSKMDNKIKCAKSASPRKSSSVPFNESRGVIDSSKAIVKKNTAAERLKRLQAGLKNELNEGISLPKLVQKNKLTEAKGKLAQMIYKKPEVLGAAKIPINTNNNNSLNFVSPPAKWSSDIIKNLSEIPLPETNFDSSIYQAKTPQTPANNRLARLRTHLTAEQQKEQMDDNMDDSEAMEWEDVSEKTINIEVSKIRSSYNVSASSTSSFVVEIQSSGLSQVCNTDTSGAAAPLVIVVDTNVFLKNLPFIDELQGHYFNSKNLFGSCNFCF